MITVMRKMIHNNAYKFILWIFLLMMALGSGLFLNHGAKEWVIQVFDKTMDANRFQAMLSSAKKRQDYFRQQGIVFGNQNIEKETAESAVSSLLTEHAMEEISLKVSDKVVSKKIDEQLRQFPSHFFHADGSLNEEMFAKQIAPFTIEDFIADIEIGEKSTLFQGILDATVYTPTFELYLQYNADFADKTYSVLSFPIQKIMAEVKKTTPSNDALEKYYKKSKNNEKFKTEEERAANVWEFSQKNYSVKISEKDIKAQYEKKKQDYLQSPAEVQVRELLLKVEAGKEKEVKSKLVKIKEQADKDPKEFAALVKKFSQKDNASKGGLSELFAKDTKEHDAILVNTAFEQLSKDDQISNIIRTKDGYEIVQRVKRNPAKYKSLDSVQSAIRKELEDVKFGTKFQRDAHRIVMQVKHHPEALTNFVNKYGGKKSEVDLGSRKTGIVDSKIFKTDEGRFAAFAEKDTGYIIQVTKVNKSVVPPLNTVKADVILDYQKSEADKELDKQLKAALVDAKTMPIDEVAKKYDVTKKEATFEYKDGKAEWSQLLRDPVVQKQVKNLINENAVTSVKTELEGLVVKLDTIAPLNKELFDKQHNKLLKDAYHMKKYQIKDGFIASLYRNAKLSNKIDIKNEILHLMKDK